MIEVIDYLVKKSWKHDNILKKQRSFNKAVVFFAYACAAYITVNQFQNKQQSEKIEELTKEIEELKQTKGE